MATTKLTASKWARRIISDSECEDNGRYGSSATLDVEVLLATLTMVCLLNCSLRSQIL